MSFKVEGQSSVRDTVIGGLLEIFIDDNKDFFSVDQLAMLEGLADDVDSAANEQDNKINELENEIDDLNNRINELEHEMEERE